MYNLATDKTIIQLIQEFYNADRIIVALYYGVAALVNVYLADGTPLLGRKRITRFSDKEEDQAYTNKITPPNILFYLQQALDKASRGKYKKADQAQAPYVILSPKLLLGQNPASAYDLGIVLLEVITKSK